MNSGVEAEQWFVLFELKHLDQNLIPGLFSVVDGVSTEFLRAVSPRFTSGSPPASLAEVTRRGRDCLMSDGRDSL